MTKATEVKYIQNIVYRPDKEFNVAEWTATMVDKLTGCRTHCLEKKSSKKKAKAVIYEKMFAKLRQMERVAHASFERFKQGGLLSEHGWLDMASFNFAAKLLVERRDKKRPYIPRPQPVVPVYTGPDRHCLNCGYGGGYKSAQLLRCRG